MKKIIYEIDDLYDKRAQVKKKLDILRDEYNKLAGDLNVSMRELYCLDDEIKRYEQELKEIDNRISELRAKWENWK